MIRGNSTVVLATPLFHSWGWMLHRLSTLLDNTEIVMRRPDAQRILELIDTHQVETLVTVPVVLRRLLEIPKRVRQRYDLSSLKRITPSCT